MNKCAHQKPNMTSLVPYHFILYKASILISFDAAGERKGSYPKGKSHSRLLLMLAPTGLPALLSTGLPALVRSNTDMHLGNNWNMLSCTLFFHQRVTLSWVSYTNICISFNVIICHFSLYFHLWENIWTVYFPGSAEATGSCAVYLHAAHSESPVYKPGECDKTAAWAALYSSTKQALNRKGISRKQEETYINATPKKNLPKATQTTQLIFLEKVSHYHFLLYSTALKKETTWYSS